jgi:hypothetical protein
VPASSPQRATFRAGAPTTDPIYALPPSKPRTIMVAPPPTTATPPSAVEDE